MWPNRYPDLIEHIGDPLRVGPHVIRQGDSQQVLVAGQVQHEARPGGGHDGAVSGHGQSPDGGARPGRRGIDGRLNSSTRAFPIPAERATQRRWARPVRERCAPDPSSTAPILRNGSRSDANGLPSTRAVPEVAWSRPSRMRSVEDFPAPLGPRNPVTRPGFAVKVMSKRIVRDPRCLVT